MKNILTCLLLASLLCIGLPSLAAESAAPPAQTSEDGKGGTQEKKEETKPEAPAPGEYGCEYFHVKLPENWQAILPPTESQGLTSAVFAKNGQNPSVTIAVSQTGGMDAKTIAEMFAQQFQAPKPPVQKNGQYIFSYTKNDVPTQVWVSVSDPLFMITAIGGNQKEGLAFIKDAVTSDKYADLFPK